MTIKADRIEQVCQARQMALDDLVPMTHLMKLFVDFTDESNTAARAKAGSLGGDQDKVSRKKRNRVDLSTAELAYVVDEIERGHILMK